MTTFSKSAFLRQQAPGLFRQLQPDTEPTFGLMTAQHMVEHLSQVIKSSVKRYGEPEDPPTDRQQGFQRFIRNGAVFKHRPGSKTRDDLPRLFYDTFEEAVNQVPIGIERFYNFYTENPDAKCYNRFMGELGFEELEIFHYQHVRYHLWQFGLLESYP